MAPGWPQDGSKMGHDGSKMAPRGPKIAPRWLQDGNATLSAMINARQKADEAKKFEKTMVFVRFWVDSGGEVPSGPRRGRLALKPFWIFLIELVLSGLARLLAI